MTTIDHRILIPAGPEAVWEYVSDITHNPDWQIDCAEVIFLTSRREGPGVRWRYSAPNGHEFVIAVTAWYNGLGYEYYFVDGVPFKENKGRIRLQEIPEGTIVQWTFTYELGGIFGGMRNTLGISRQVNGTISESLKMLYQKIKQSGVASRPHEAKSLMRDAPNVDARSAYQPRHPSVMEEEKSPAAPKRLTAEPPISEGDGQRIRVIAEPPVAEDDTRKRKVVAPPPLPEEAIPADIEGEPDFLKQIVDLSRFEPPRSPSDTQPRRPVTQEEIAQPKAEARPLVEDTEPLAVTPPAVLPGYPASVEEPTAPAAEVRDETQPDYVSPARIYERPTPPPVEAVTPPEAAEAPPFVVEPESRKPVEETTPVQEVADPPAVEPHLVEPPVVEAKAEPEKPAEPPAVESRPEALKPIESPAAEATPESLEPVEQPPVRVEPTTTSESASIWEIFGLPRPSETQEAEAAPSTAPIEATPAAAPAPIPVNEAAALAPDAQAETEAGHVEKLALPPGSTRAGLRIALRRKLIFVRRP